MRDSTPRMTCLTPKSVVSDWLNDTNYSSDGKNLDSIPYPETENYVDKVESAKEMYIKLYYSQSN
mgnify:CR=1 FL=1